MYGAISLLDEVEGCKTVTSWWAITSVELQAKFRVAEFM